MEGELLAQLRMAEERLRQLEYVVQLLKQQLARTEQAASMIRSAGAT